MAPTGAFSFIFQRALARLSALRRLALDADWVAHQATKGVYKHVMIANHYDVQSHFVRAACRAPGSRLTGRQSQNITLAVRATADAKFMAKLSWRVATDGQVRRLNHSDAAISNKSFYYCQISSSRKSRRLPPGAVPRRPNHGVAQPASANTGLPSARHSGRPPSRRRALSPWRRRMATAWWA